VGQGLVLASACSAWGLQHRLVGSYTFIQTGSLYVFTTQPVHFHGPAAPGANAGVVLPIPVPAAPLPSPAEGLASLTEAQVAEVRAGRWYVNVHTGAHPG
jgi:hypothetical protein